MSCTALIKYLFPNDRILRMVEEELGQLFTNKNTNIERWLKKGEVIYSQMQAHFQPLKLDTIYCCSFSKTSSSNSSPPYTEPHHDTVKYNLQDYCVNCTKILACSSLDWFADLLNVALENYFISKSMNHRAKGH